MTSIEHLGCTKAFNYSKHPKKLYSHICTESTKKKIIKLEAGDGRSNVQVLQQSDLYDGENNVVVIFISISKTQVLHWFTTQQTIQKYIYRKHTARPIGQEVIQKVHIYIKCSK